MQNNVILLRDLRPSDGQVVCPAQFYKFTGDPNMALGNNAFMEKAAAFQEIRDCLTNADHNRLSTNEAERVIRYLARAYLDTR
jgi:hypothetical protein